MRREDERLALAFALSSISFLRADEKKILFKRIASLEDFFRLSTACASEMIGRKIGREAWDEKSIVREVERAKKLSAIYKIGCTLFCDEDFPKLARHRYDCPFALFYRGNLQALCAPCVSIVGTRRPSQKGASEAALFAEEVSRLGATVVSGMAFGIDAAAHRGALRANGKTVAVLANGVDNFTPNSHKNLAAAILHSGGAVISEFLPGKEAHPWTFVQRNAVISALSGAIVVGEAPRKSGALITASFAVEQNRDLFFLPSAKLRAQSEADCGKKNDGKKDALQFLADGAKLAESAREVFESADSLFCAACEARHEFHAEQIRARSQASLFE